MHSSNKAVARSLSVHCHFMASIVCCSVKHKLSRQASSSRSTTSADRQSNLPLAQRTDVDNKTKCQRSTLKLKYSDTKTYILNKQSRLLSTSCKALKSKSSKSVTCRVRKAEFVLPGELHRFLYDSQCQGFFFFPSVDVQPDCRSATTLNLHPQLSNSHAREASQWV